MKLYLGVLLATILGASFTTALADPPMSNEDMMKKLYSVLSKSLTLDDTTPQVGSVCLVLCHPGIPIDSTYANADAASAALTPIIDVAMQPSWLYTPNRNLNIYQYYSMWLNDCTLPDIHGSPQDVANQDKAKQELYASDKPTQMLLNYRTARDAYTKASSAVNAAAAADLHGNAGQSLIDAQTDAYNDWLAANKTQVEADQGVMAQLLDSNAMRGALNTQLVAATRHVTAGAPGFGMIGYYPSVPSWTDDSTWTHLTLTSNDIKNAASASSTNIGGSAGVSFGMFHIGGSGGASSSSHDSSSSTDNIDIDLKLKRIIVDRYYMNTLFWLSQSWDWKPKNQIPDVLKDDKLRAISNGQVGPDLKGSITLLPVGLLLSKDVTIHGVLSTSQAHDYQQTKSAGGSFGWGPFHIGGSGGGSSSSSWSEGAVTDDKITVSGMQIIGFYCEVVPQLPNPDMSLPWPNHPTPATTPTSTGH